MKKTILILCLILFCLGLGKGIYFARKGFSLRRVAAPVRLQLEAWDSKADEILQQPFHYLGRGRQCFAFESADGKTILKFPRTDIYQIPFLEKVLPALSRRGTETREEREKFILNSMRIAFEDLHEETGVLALHLCQTEDLGKKLTIRDSLGLTYHLPVAKTAFVLQAKYPILMKAFTAALEDENKEKAKEILDAFIDVVVKRGQKGIWNKDGSFLRNYGFDGQKGYQIDIGSFYFKDDWVASVRDSFHPVRSWLENLDEGMLSYFDESLETRIKEFRDI